MHMFYNHCAVNVQINGIENIKIYIEVTYGGVCLIMTKNVKLLVLTRNNDGLTLYVT